MKAISQRQLIQTVVKRWEAHCNSSPYDWKFEALAKLRKLDLDTCSAKDVNDIIGNSSWTRLKCDDCQKETDFVLVLGEEPDFESNTARLCRYCVLAAFSLLPTDGWTEEKP